MAAEPILTKPMANQSESNPDDVPMSFRQWLVIALCILMMALDGFDVLSISFASTGISKEWGINFAQLGWLLSLELFGMAVGAVTNGWVADRLGRRPVLLSCLIMTGIGMTIAGHAPNLGILATGRIITGLGIGGILVCANSIAAEFSSASMRTLSIALVGAGYPMGAAAGGFAAAALLEHGGWRYVFNLGAVIALAILPMAYWLVSESPSWLRKRLAGKSAAQSGESRPARWSKSLVVVAILVTSIYLLHVISFYYLLKWIPRILTAGGYAASAAARVLSWMNVGGMIGGVALGVLAGRTRTYPVTMALLFCSVASVVAFGLAATHPDIVAAVCMFAGFACNGAILGIYAVIAKSFPVELRATGIGIAIGVGRFGAVLAPIVAGYLLETGMSVPVVSTIMACGSLFSAVALYRLGRAQADSTA